MVIFILKNGFGPDLIPTRTKIETPLSRENRENRFSALWGRSWRPFGRGLLLLGASKTLGAPAASDRPRGAIVERRWNHFGSPNR